MPVRRSNEVPAPGARLAPEFPVSAPFRAELSAAAAENSSFDTEGGLTSGGTYPREGSIPSSGTLSRRELIPVGCAHHRQRPGTEYHPRRPRSQRGETQTAFRRGGRTHRPRCNL